MSSYIIVSLRKSYPSSLHVRQVKVKIFKIYKCAAARNVYTYLGMDNINKCSIATQDFMGSSRNGI